MKSCCCKLLHYITNTTIPKSTNTTEITLRALLERDNGRSVVLTENQLERMIGEAEKHTTWPYNSTTFSTSEFDLEPEPEYSALLMDKIEGYSKHITDATHFLKGVFSQQQSKIPSSVVDAAVMRGCQYIDYVSVKPGCNIGRPVALAIMLTLASGNSLDWFKGHQACNNEMGNHEAMCLIELTSVTNKYTYLLVVGPIKCAVAAVLETTHSIKMDENKCITYSLKKAHIDEHLPMSQVNVITGLSSSYGTPIKMGVYTQEKTNSTFKDRLVEVGQCVKRSVKLIELEEFLYYETLLSTAPHLLALLALRRHTLQELQLYWNNNNETSRWIGHIVCTDVTKLQLGIRTNTDVWLRAKVLVREPTESDWPRVLWGMGNCLSNSKNGDTHGKYSVNGKSGASEWNIEGLDAWDTAEFNRVFKNGTVKPYVPNKANLNIEVDYDYHYMFYGVKEDKLNKPLPLRTVDEVSDLSTSLKEWTGLWRDLRFMPLDGHTWSTRITEVMQLLEVETASAEKTELIQFDQKDTHMWLLNPKNYTYKDASEMMVTRYKKANESMPNSEFSIDITINPTILGNSAGGITLKNVDALGRQIGNLYRKKPNSVGGGTYEKEMIKIMGGKPKFQKLAQSEKELWEKLVKESMMLSKVLQDNITTNDSIKVYRLDSLNITDAGELVYKALYGQISLADLNGGEYMTAFKTTNVGANTGIMYILKTNKASKELIRKKTEQVVNICRGITIVMVIDNLHVAHAYKTQTDNQVIFSRKGPLGIRTCAKKQRESLIIQAVSGNRDTSTSTESKCALRLLHAEDDDACYNYPNNNTGFYWSTAYMLGAFLTKDSDLFKFKLSICDQPAFSRNINTSNVVSVLQGYIKFDNQSTNPLMTSSSTSSRTTMSVIMCYQEQNPVFSNRLVT